MKELLTAIYTKYTGCALASSLTGGLHADEAPPETAFPFGVLTVVDVNPIYTMNTVHELARVQFDLFHNNHSSLLDIYDSLRTIFDDCTLSVTGYSFVSMIRSSAQKVRDGDYWRVSVDYMVRYEK